MLDTPLTTCVCGRTVVVGVDVGAVDEAAGAEVDELQSMTVKVDDDILVLDVTVNDASSLDVNDRLNDVTEPLTTRQRLAQRAVRRDVVEQILYEHTRHGPVSKISKFINTRTPPVEAHRPVVTYLQFPIQVCLPCNDHAQPATRT